MWQRALLQGPWRPGVQYVTVPHLIGGDVYCAIADSEFAHSCCKGLDSMYFLFHTALWDHWGALRLISTRSLFRSYSASKLSSSCKVVPRWAQFCRTAPSICNSSLLACVIGRGVHRHLFNDHAKHWTSIVTSKLIFVRLQLHVSGASKPRLASSASAGNSGCSFFFNNQLKAVHRLVLCLSGLGWGSLEVTISSNQVGESIWPYRIVWVCILNTFPAQTVVHGGTIHYGQRRWWTGRFMLPVNPWA